MIEKFSFFYDFYEDDILYFHRGEYNSYLFVGLPGDWIISKEENISRGGLTVVWISSKAGVVITERYKIIYINMRTKSLI
jgi:hypothetical protein